MSKRNWDGPTPHDHMGLPIGGHQDWLTLALAIIFAAAVATAGACWLTQGASQDPTGDIAIYGP